MKLRFLKHHVTCSAKELKEYAHRAGYSPTGYKEMLQRALPNDKLQYSDGINVETGGPAWVDVPTQTRGVDIADLAAKL